MSKDINITDACPFGWDVGEPLPTIREPLGGEGWEVRADGTLWVDGRPASLPPVPVTRSGLQGWVYLVRSARRCASVAERFRDAKVIEFTKATTEAALKVVSYQPAAGHVAGDEEGER